MTSSDPSGKSLKSSPIEELIGVMKHLRDPVNGCHGILIRTLTQ